MKIISKKNLENFSLPLPIYSSVHIADAITKDGEEFSIFIGLDKKYTEQLQRLSLDKTDVDLQNNTGDRRRFGEGSYEDWYRKDRTPFMLIHKRTDALAALVWFGPKSLGKKSIKFGIEEKDKEQTYWHTAVWRSYPSFRGKGLMKNFTLFAMDIYEKKFSGLRFWAGMDNKNNASVKFSLALGFKADEENSDLAANWLVVVK
ncbi:MAG: hypothetical protein WCV70_03525 [Patescibacteria group bacterium]|jgi:hypothetical protein